MSIESILSLQVSVNGEGVNENYAAPGFPLTNQNAPGGVPTKINLVLGFNAIPVPAGTRFIIINPPAGSTTALTLKGVTGDAGTPIDPAFPSVFSVPAATTTLGITAAAAVGSVAFSFL